MIASSKARFVAGIGVVLTMGFLFVVLVMESMHPSDGLEPGGIVTTEKPL